MDNNGYVPEDNGKIFAITRYSPVSNIAAAVNSSANLVEINSKGRLWKRPSCYKRLSLLLCLLSLIILAVLIAITYLYIKSTRTPKICNSPECLRSAANLLFSMDTSVDPCDDFYQFSCGHWSDQHPNHGWYPKFSNFESIEERITIATVKLLESNSTDKEPLPVRQSRDLYRSCMDEDAIDRQGYDGMYKYLRMANMSLVPHFLDVTERNGELSFDWMQTEATIKKIFYMDVFIGFTVDSNIYERSNYSMYIGAPGAACPLPSPWRSSTLRKGIIVKTDNTTTKDEDEDYDDEERKNAHKRIFKHVVKAILTNLSVTIPEDSILEEAFTILVNITESIDEMMGNATVASEYIPNIYTVSKLQEITDNYVVSLSEKPNKAWNQYLKYMFTNVNVTLRLDGSDVVMIDPDDVTYLSKITYFLLKTPDAYLELYMWWVTVYAMIINTTSEIAEYMAKQAAPITHRTNVMRSRSLDCAAIVTNFMGMAVSYGIADRTFMNSTMPKVQEMLLEIKEAFVERVNQIQWMDKLTKQKTLQKAQHMTSFIGFPEWLFDAGALDEYYEGVEIFPDKYLENMMEIIRLYMPERLGLLESENPRTWRTDPITVNAYNYFADNAINIPMAILSFPVYNLGLEVLNYGAIGAILGHELTHGFDNTGMKYDFRGSYNQWWTNNTVEAFENLTNCFVRQYDNYTVPKVTGHIDGMRTLGENMADNGGLHHSYLAYKYHIRKYGSEPILPGLEKYTMEQLFFIAFGNIWCESAPLQTLKDQIDSDEHCPNYVRVLGTLQNSYEFAEAFHCPVGSKMNPNKTKCRIW